MTQLIKIQPCCGRQAEITFHFSYTPHPRDLLPKTESRICWLCVKDVWDMIESGEYPDPEIDRDGKLKLVTNHVVPQACESGLAGEGR
jgi:hypothetical protein